MGRDQNRQKEKKRRKENTILKSILVISAPMRAGCLISEIPEISVCRRGL